MKETQSLSEAEFKLMLSLLKRHAENDMDQWETWRINSEKRECPLCITITLGPDPNADIESYYDLSHLID